VKQAVERLAELLGVAFSDAVIREESGARGADAVADLAGFTFVLEWKSSGASAPVSMAAERARQRASKVGQATIPIVAVPYMGTVGRERCEASGVAWLDLSGNARIVASGLRVLIDGQPNQFKRRGRPSSAFAPRSARIARWLLMHAGESMTQREIARATDMDEGFTSRIVAKLEEDELVARDPAGGIRARDPDLLLDAWREVYDFSKHRIVRGHVPARSGDALLRRLAELLQDSDSDYAATGLGASWLLTRFAGFRIVSIYLPEQPSSELLDRLGFREDERGANVWLVVPNDAGVFHGATDHDGVRCVHPVQAYLDLKQHPERANEAAEQLRAELIRWSDDD
jgi:hypothetical protein